MSFIESCFPFWYWYYSSNFVQSHSYSQELLIRFHHIATLIIFRYNFRDLMGSINNYLVLYSFIFHPYFPKSDEMSYLFLASLKPRYHLEIDLRILYLSASYSAYFCSFQSSIQSIIWQYLMSLAFLINHFWALKCYSFLMSYKLWIYHSFNRQSIYLIQEQNGFTFPRDYFLVIIFSNVGISVQLIAHQALSA